MLATCITSIARGAAADAAIGGADDLVGHWIDPDALRVALSHGSGSEVVAHLAQLLDDRGVIFQQPRLDAHAIGKPAG